MKKQMKTTRKHKKTLPLYAIIMIYMIILETRLSMDYNAIILVTRKGINNK
jgi:uncharacterized membrane protein YadS